MVYTLKPTILLVSIQLLLSSVSGHMMMSSPSPRRAKGNPNYPESQVDYSMTAPLGPEFPFPCRGYGPGGSSGTFQAGSSIPVTLSGGASHNGGHCQFSVSYDGTNFAVLKTVFGTCMIDSLNYSVDLPKDMPNGKVTLAWTWINKTGNREYYMNCADITIQGGSSYGGKVTGPRMVVANINGGPTFPENFANDYGKAQYYDSAQTITVSPNGSSNPDPKPPTYPSAVPEPSTTPKPTPPVYTPIPPPPASSSYPVNPKPSPPSSSYPVNPKPSPSPSNYPVNPKPSSSPPQTGGCNTGDSRCDSKGLQICSNNVWYDLGCAPSTVCKVINANQALCDWKY